MSDPSPKAQNPDRPAKPSGRRRLKRAMIYLIGIYLVWLVIGFFIQREVLFPTRLIDVPAVPFLYRYGNVKVLHIDTKQGKVEGWFFPGEGVDPEHPGPLVIFAHGNGELIDHWSFGLSGYTELGVSVLLPEFRGYGRSAGSPGQRAIVEDYAAFYDLVTASPEVDASRVILHGRSIGGGVVAQLATVRPSAAMILQSTPAKVTRLAARFLFPWFLIRDPFDSVSAVRRYEQPVLVMHGTADTLVPPSHAERISNASTHPQSRLIWYDVDHNTLPDTYEYWSDIEQFLKDSGILE